VPQRRWSGARSRNWTSRLGCHLIGMMDVGPRACSEATAAAAAAGGRGLGALFADHELMKHHALGYERHALIAELLRLFCCTSSV
jgi:hypothetical protein